MLMEGGRKNTQIQSGGIPSIEEYLVSQSGELSDTHLQVKINTQESQFRSKRNQ